MTTKAKSPATLQLEMDADARSIFGDILPDLERQLHKKAPGVTVTHIGGPQGSKDAAAVITATAGLIVAATPIITTLLSRYFADRGYDIHLDAKNGKLSIKKTPNAVKAPTQARKKAGKPKATP